VKNEGLQGLVVIVIVVIVFVMAISMAIAVMVVITVVITVMIFVTFDMVPPVSFVIAIAVVAVLPPRGMPFTVTIGRPDPSTRTPDVTPFDGGPEALDPNKAHLRRRRRRCLILDRRGWCADRNAD